MKCRKCGKTLNDCQGCNGGRGNLTCRQCNTTGLVCSTHNGYWK